MCRASATKHRKPAMVKSKAPAVAAVVVVAVVANDAMKPITTHRLQP